jgi:hypothetical protein
MNAVVELARRFVAAAASTSPRIPELELFPADNLVPGSQTLQSADAFGFDQFKNVFTAQYQLDERELTTFITSCPNADAATTLRAAYRAFLLDNGGKELESAANPDLGKPIEIMGGVEIVFRQDNLVAGVHAAPSLQSAQQLAARLRERLIREKK